MRPQIYSDAVRGEIAALLDAARGIPQEEMPDAAARDALLVAIRAGRVIGVYRPFGSTRHNIELAGPRDVELRISCAEWAARVDQSGQGERGGQG
jgi:hypothetical protein